MRRSRRFRRIFRKLNIFVVVFVALVNACFYMPMDVQAGVVGGAETLMSIDGIDPYGPYTYITGQTPGWTTINDLSWSNDSKNTFDVSFSVVGIGDGSDFSKGNYFVWYGVMVFQTLLSPSVAEHSYLEPTVHTTVYDDNPYPLDDCNFSYGAYFPYSPDGSNGYVDVCVPVMLSGSYDDFIGALKFEFQMTLHYWGVDAPSLNTLYFWLSSQSLQVFDTRQEYDNVLEQIEHNTGATTDAVNNGFNETMNGYDSTSGDQVASDFESGAASYDQAEDNLFNSADSALTGFKFFDFSTFGSITTGLSFVSGIMTSIYNNFGAMQGLGIVLSVLFSVMFMAIVIGFYRYFK